MIFCEINHVNQAGKFKSCDAIWHASYAYVDGIFVENPDFHDFNINLLNQILKNTLKTQLSDFVLNFKT